MDNKMYLHAIYARSYFYDSKMTLYVLEQILKANALLSARLQNKTECNSYFNGLDYISLCDYEKRHLTSKIASNSYNGYIKNSLSLIFPKDKFDVITPEIIELKYNKKYYETIRLLGMSEETRYSDLPDEVQVKDKISLDYLQGVTLPLDKMNYILMSEKRMVDFVLREYEKITKLLDKYHHSVPIYDIDTFEKLDSVDNIKRLVKYHKNRG